MEKIKKYDRIYRICPKILNNVPAYLLEKVADPPKRKKCLSESDIKVLLSGHTVLEEKVDGGIVGLAWNGNHHLAVGKHSMINPYDNSKKFYGLNSWIYANYEKIQKIPLGWIIYGEWLKVMHNIFYDCLEDFFYAFDIWDGHRYLDTESRSEFLRRLGFAEVPIIFNGYNLDVVDILKIAENNGDNKSRYSSNEIFEGIVIKNYDKGLMGKYIRKEFMDSMEKHWLESPIMENKLKIYGETKNCINENFSNRSK